MISDILKDLAEINEVVRFEISKIFTSTFIWKCTACHLDIDAGWNNQILLIPVKEVLLPSITPELKSKKAIEYNRDKGMLLEKICEDCYIKLKQVILHKIDKETYIPYFGFYERPLPKELLFEK